MQYINNDMDELYKRAAEDYPLNTNSAHWSSVLKRLSAKNSEKKNINQDNKKSYKRLLLLLLLLPIAWMGKNYLYQSNDQYNNSLLAERVSKNILTSLNFLTSGKKLQSSNTVQEELHRQQAPVHLIQKSVRHKPSLLQSVTIIPISNTDIQDKAAYSIAEGQINKEEKKITTNNEDGTMVTKNSNENTITLLDNNKTETNKTAAAKDRNHKQKVQGIYAGIMISPDVSTVKFQSVKNAGFAIGLLIGYQLNKNIGLESGIAWNKKYYYSDGKYFNAKNITLPAYAQIKKLDGMCKMIEIPVMVKYNFKSSVKSNLSVSAGMSSYIMKDENYNYTIERSGQQYERSADYKNSSTDLFAVANLSLGYNRSLGNGSTLRLEPYIKIPVKGFGIGNLPIMSTGINIAITKKLFK